MKPITSDPTQDPLENTAWQLTAYLNAHGALVPPVAAATFTFQAGRVHGNTGCNRFGAGYTRAGAQLTIAQAASTRMACPEANMVQEQAVLANLSRVARYDLPAEQLRLFDVDSQLLFVFVPQGAA